MDILKATNIRTAVRDEFRDTGNEKDFRSHFVQKGSKFTLPCAHVSHTNYSSPRDLFAGCARVPKPVVFTEVERELLSNYLSKDYNKWLMGISSNFNGYTGDGRHSTLEIEHYVAVRARHL